MAIIGDDHQVVAAREETMRPCGRTVAASISKHKHVPQPASQKRLQRTSQQKILVESLKTETDVWIGFKPMALSNAPAQMADDARAPKTGALAPPKALQPPDEFAAQC
jgi:hypothetical protein